MSGSDRVTEYRQWAAIALRRAAAAQGSNLKRSYLELAQGWKRLADQVEEQEQLASTVETAKDRKAKPSTARRN